MPFSSLIGNERIKRSLARAVAAGRIGQSLIFAGPRGIGKHRFAIALAQALNCDRPLEGDACGECLPCRKIESGEHLDVRTVVADGQFIKIEQVRNVSDSAEYRPYEGKHRVYIFDDADRMNEPAANSLLKTLEEPPTTSLIILVTTRPFSLRETIRSRCQMLTFAPLTADELQSFLTRELEPEQARLIARLAQGSIGQAREIDLEAFRERRNTMLALVETLASRDTVRMINAAEYLGRKLDRAEFDKHIDTLLILLSDLFNLKVGEDTTRLTNSDVAPRLEALATAIGADELIDWAHRVEEILQALRRNVSRQLALEHFFLSV